MKSLSELSLSKLGVGLLVFVYADRLMMFHTSTCTKSPIKTLYSFRVR